MQTSLLGRRVRGKYFTGEYKNDLMQWSVCEGEVVAVSGNDSLLLWVLDADCLVRRVPVSTAVVIPRDAETPLR